MPTSEYIVFGAIGWVLTCGAEQSAWLARRRDHSGHVYIGYMNVFIFPLFDVSYFCMLLFLLVVVCI